MATLEMVLGVIGAVWVVAVLLGLLMQDARLREWWQRYIGGR